MFGPGKIDASTAAPEIAAAALLTCADSADELDAGIFAGAVVSAMVYAQALAVGVEKSALTDFTEKTLQSAAPRNLLLSAKFMAFAVLCAKAIEMSAGDLEYGLQDEFWKTFSRNAGGLSYEGFLALTGMVGTRATSAVRSNYVKWNLSR